MCCVLLYVRPAIVLFCCKSVSERSYCLPGVYYSAKLVAKLISFPAVRFAIHLLVERKKKTQEQVKELIGIKESDTGLSQPSQWDLVSDKQMMQEEQPLQVIESY